MAEQVDLGVPHALVAGVALAVSPKGLRVPADAENRSMSVSPDVAALIRALAGGGSTPLAEVIDRVAGERGVEPDKLRDAALVLRDRGLLVAGVAPVRSAPTGVAPRHRAVDPARDDEVLVARLPILVRPEADGFDLLDHDGAIRFRLGEADLAVLTAFGRPTTIAEAIDTGDADARRIVEELLGAALVGDYDPERSPQARSEREMKAMATSITGFVGALKDDLERRRAAEAERQRERGVTRTRVVPVLAHPGLAPLSLGMILAYAEHHDGGRLAECYEFLPNWYIQDRDVAEYADRPTIYLFSNYAWSSNANLDRSAKVKAANPQNITIHGGPDTPRRAHDVEAYFAAHPHVDVAVHGEGEVTTADILEWLASTRRADGSLDLHALAAVPGLSFRDGDEVVRTEDRERLADLDLLPSPYLSGTFEAFANGNATAAIIETNRGCPYGCTFCDWGSATLSRIRKFDLDRVFAELEWCARNRVSRIFIADANFGIMERDVAIAEKVAELKTTYGYPRAFATNYAKNTVKHLKRIVQVMVEADVLTEGLLSLQTMDEGTLSTVKRSNIKTEKYDLLANEFRAAGLPLFVDLMMGLPGSTTASFRNDLQECIEREVTAKIFQTEVLVNSPMNEPAYREQHKIETAFAGDRLYDTRVDESSKSRRALVVSTASFTREDFAEMTDLRRAFRLFENFGVLRQVTRYVRQETATREVDLIDLVRRASKDRASWPYLALTVDVVPEVMVPPMSWALFLDEVRRFVVSEVGVADDDALATVLAVQRALLPASGREFPCVLELPHDYEAWHGAVIAAKEAHVGDWTGVVPRLRSFPAGRLEVDDPRGVCSGGLGFRNEDDFYGDWELRSPVSRAMPAKHQVEA